MVRIDPEQVVRHVLTQAFVDGSAMHWRRMAERFEAELRRPPDSTHPNVYRPSATERAEREQRLAAQAAACRCAARFYAEHMHVDDLVPEDVELIDDVLGEQLPNAVCSSGVA